MDNIVFSILVFLSQNHDPSCHINGLGSSLTLSSSARNLAAPFPLGSCLILVTQRFLVIIPFLLCLWQIILSD